MTSPPGPAPHTAAVAALACPWKVAKGVRLVGLWAPESGQGLLEGRSDSCSTSSTGIESGTGFEIYAIELYIITN